MKVKCDYCGIEFEKRKSSIRKKNYCCKEHRHKDKYIDLKCNYCGKQFERLKVSYLGGKSFCCISCAKYFTSERMHNYNLVHNKDSMSMERRKKISRARRKTSQERVSYEKFLGRHYHRYLIEQSLGRKLQSDEVVHHIDGNKQNNSLDNLKVMSRSEHSKIHYLMRK